MVRILIGLVLLVLSALAVERFVFNDQHLNSKKIAKTEKGEECLSNANPTFTAEFIDRSKILYFKPLGDTQGLATRSKIVLKERVEVPIYNPTDATLEEVTEKDGKYSLLLRVSCEVSFIFSDLDKVSEKIQPKAEIKKGELLGYVKSTSQGNSFDFMVSNTSKPVSYINPKRWEKEALYAQCPFEYFDTRNDNNLKRDYIGYNLVHNENIIQRVWTKEQGVDFIPCGDVSHDLKGAASGGWFKGESTNKNGDYLSVNKYLSTVQVSVRKDGKLVESLTDYAPDVLLSDLTAGKSACYHDANKNIWAYVKLVSDAQLALAKGTGSCPVSFPEGSEVWER